ncbi:hypothetical protein OsJ_00679 [Oryza sativa Japonica Group]|uniref:Reverse transcriptase zinc-binding domain-containing protein n=1 Tax=Oryza sativa subsp. japonica TaxID=39947 RepID=B9ETJ8_ORYSJ|nr:hypothetical protein OsJ_00679 [Oryza sativa Japonica Group]
MEIRFWEDTWLGLQPLKYQYPSLYNVVRKRHSTLVEVMSTTPLNVSFRRSIVGPKLVEWNDLISRLANITLSNEKDCFIWSLYKNGHFSVKSMYNAIINSNVIIHKRILWKVKVPLKIKVFMWFLHKKVILTKDNLIKRKWRGNKQCCFCNTQETIQHFFFDCHVARFSWRCVFFAFNIPPPHNA